MLRCNMRALNHPCGPETSTSLPQDIPPSSSYGGMFTRPSGPRFFALRKIRALGSGFRAAFDTLTGSYYHSRLCKMRSREVQASLATDLSRLFHPDIIEMKTYSAKPQDVTREWY